MEPGTGRKPWLPSSPPRSFGPASAQFHLVVHKQNSMRNSQLGHMPMSLFRSPLSPSLWPLVVPTRPLAMGAKHSGVFLLLILWDDGKGWLVGLTGCLQDKCGQLGECLEFFWMMFVKEREHARA